MCVTSQRLEKSVNSTQICVRVFIHRLQLLLLYLAQIQLFEGCLSSDKITETTATIPSHMIIYYSFAVFRKISESIILIFISRWATLAVCNFYTLLTVQLCFKICMQLLKCKPYTWNGS